MYYYDHRITGEPTGSICPKGWKLPQGNSEEVGSYYYMLSMYGFNSQLTATLGDTTYNIAGAPFRFVKSGILATRYTIYGTTQTLDSPYTVGYLNLAGQNGAYWTFTPVVDNTNFNYNTIYTDRAYTLSVNKTAIKNNIIEDGFLGLSVRCINDDTI